MHKFQSIHCMYQNTNRDKIPIAIHGRLDDSDWHLALLFRVCFGVLALQMNESVTKRLNYQQRNLLWSTMLVMSSMSQHNSRSSAFTVCRNRMTILFCFQQLFSGDFSYKLLLTWQCQTKCKMNCSTLSTRLLATIPCCTRLLWFSICFRCVKSHGNCT